ncbi:type II secretion system protein GspL [Mameliella sediminis]|uniref:type II secretion system protein GspL n=1 Tax=Mameliella sediminis TaxID=2836866 RepID=UPI001C43C670|nr:type II secretion system protein GspL [Mameliella sediminis]MBV7394470.1 hypothetical protein [Mameliella sediminis]
MTERADPAFLPTDPGLPTAPISGPQPRGRYVALVPGEQVPLLLLDLPPGVRGAAREQVAQRQLADVMGARAGATQMRPFALEGEAESWTRVLVTERDVLDQWRAKAGGRCVAILPDYLALPVAKGDWSVSGSPSRVRARFGPHDGVTTTEAALCLQATRIIADGNVPGKVVRLGPPLPAFEALLADKGIEWQTQPDPDARAFARGEAALDLRADPQASRTRLRRQVRVWQWPVLTGAVAAALWAAAQMTVIRAVEQETVALTARSVEITRAEFLPAGPILDLRVQVARALAEQRGQLRADSGQASPLDLFADAAPVLSGAEARLQSVDWTPGEGLRLGVEMGDFAAVDALVEALAAGGLRVSIRDARLGSGGSVEADLTVAEPEQGG